MKSNFVFYQPNCHDPKLQFGDCSIRALCKSEGKTWLEIYDELCRIGRILHSMPNGKTAYEKYLKSHKYEYIGVTNKKGSKRPTVNSFCYDNPQGTFIAVVANHYVCIQDGKYHDTWDSGDKSMYGFWQKTT